MMNESIRMQENPFDLPNVDIPDPIDSVSPFFLPHRQFLRDFNKLPPCVILCSPAMMENGTSRDVLERMASGENNLVILTGYCMAVFPRFLCDVADDRAPAARQRPDHPAEREADGDDRREVQSGDD